MRTLCLSTLLAAGVAFASTAVSASVPPFKGNDTGGIIAWSPEADYYRHQIAGDHCAGYNKMHRITSVRARYGDYIGFRCYWPRGTSGVILRSAY